MTKRRAAPVGAGQRPIKFTSRMVKQMEAIQAAKKVNGRSAVVKLALEAFAEAIKADVTVRAKDVEDWVANYVSEALGQEEALKLVTVYFAETTAEAIFTIGTKLNEMIGKVPTLRTVLLAWNKTYNRPLLIALALEWYTEAMKLEGNELTLR